MAIDSFRYSNNNDNNNIKLKRTPVFEFAICHRRTSKTYQVTGNVMKSMTFNMSCDSTENKIEHIGNHSTKTPANENIAWRMRKDEIRYLQTVVTYTK